jgi:Na+-transporting methylmalonyl-CoA/oxaloacetate decarboxylase gamma subunit
MELKDALTVTGLGIGVVFIGLLLTSLMIYSFSFIPRLAGLFMARLFKPVRAPVKSEPVKPAKPVPPVDPGVIAVISTVLEAEWRLRTALLE